MYALSVPHRQVLEAMDEITQASCSKAVADVHKLMSNIAGAESMANKRDAQIGYRGVPVEIQVFSLAEELALRTSAALKERAVIAGKLEALHCEEDLVDAATAHRCLKLDENMLVQAKAARKSANSMVTAEGDPSGIEMRDILQAKKGILLQLDKGFKLEIALITSFTGEGGERRLIHKVTDCLSCINGLGIMRPLVVLMMPGFEQHAKKGANNKENPGVVRQRPFSGERINLFPLDHPTRSHICLS